MLSVISGMKPMAVPEEFVGNVVEDTCTPVSGASELRQMRRDQGPVDG